MTKLDYFQRRSFCRYVGIAIIFFSFVIVKYSVDYEYQSPTIANLQSTSIKTSLPASLSPSEHILTHRYRKNLPNFKNGGVVVFYHIYKTGGSTVGKMFHEMYLRDKLKREQYFNNASTVSPSSSSSLISSPKLYFTMIRKNIDWEKDCLVTLNLAKEEKKLLMLELHVEYPAPNFPSLVELAPMIQRWRKGAKDRGIDFFAFTLIRNPIAHALSFFNFFHVGHNEFRPPPTQRDHDYWNPFQQLTSSEGNFLKSYFVNNRQCRMYDSDPEAIRYAPDALVWKRTDSRSSSSSSSINRNEEEQTDNKVVPLSIPVNDRNKNDSCKIDGVRNALFEALDWVGTTEQLQNVTLPLLTKIIANDPSVGRNNVPFKVFDKAGKKGLKVADLSKSTFLKIFEETKLDRQLYKDVARIFTLENLEWDINT